MENQRRLANNINRYEAGHSGVPRKGAALLQGIAVCGQCGRRMSLRYSGPAGDYPVYTCRADRDQGGGPLCQEVRALPVDAHVESILLKALRPDQIAIAIAALGQIEEETRQLERQWALRRERARYEAERARRQYDAVEPENRLVARSLERGWEEKLRAAEAIELNAAGKMDKEIAAALNAEGFVAARGCAFKGENVWLLRTRWGIPTVKINGTSANPDRWPDGTYSVQGAAAALGVTPQTVFDYLARGWLEGRQLTKGQPWQIELSDDQINTLRTRIARNRRSRKEAS